MITHYDLFAGIGGFSLALEEVFTDETIEHIFCEWERFPTAVLKKHWPDGEYWGDIAELVTHTKSTRLERERGQKPPRTKDARHFTIVTGGFPCQPFSAAGRRRGTDDHRYQWPNMFEVIRNTAPEWVIAENVRGLITWNDGMVLQQVCTDLESIGYQVQPFIIPAVSVNAPHRRDRVWIIGTNTTGDRRQRKGAGTEEKGRQPGLVKDRELARGSKGHGGVVTNATRERNGGSTSQKRGAQERIMEPEKRQRGEVRSESQGRAGNLEYPNWNRDWQEVAVATGYDRVDDGLPRWMDGTAISGPKHRQERIKAMGNAIVPEVAMQIFKAIKEAHYGIYA